jgi:hypothetical protein
MTARSMARRPDTEEPVATAICFALVAQAKCLSPAPGLVYGIGTLKAEVTQPRTGRGSRTNLEIGGELLHRGAASITLDARPDARVNLF